VVDPAARAQTVMCQVPAGLPVVSQAKVVLVPYAGVAGCQDALAPGGRSQKRYSALAQPLAVALKVTAVPVLCGLVGVAVSETPVHDTAPAP
jgi:hypothetical protein